MRKAPALGWARAFTWSVGHDLNVVLPPGMGAVRRLHLRRLPVIAAAQGNWSTIKSVHHLPEGELL